MEAQLNDLKNRLLEIDDLQRAGAVLHWDQTTYMPPGGGAARGRQMATLGRLAHEKSSDPALGRLLDALEPWAASQPYEADAAALIRLARREYDLAVKIPPALIAAVYAHSAVTYQTWAAARPRNDFAAVQHLLEKMLDLSRQVAECFPGYAHLADPLIDNADPGMRVANLRPLFAELRQALVPLAQAIAAQTPADDACLHAEFPEAGQHAFSTALIRRLGYDFERGRVDKTHHPFMTKFAAGDVRITTRYHEHDLGDGLFSMIHEAGHALYEQGIDPALDGTPLNRGASAGVHESQSRLWENVVGRSREFWEHFYPALQAGFPDQLGRVPLDVFHRAINTVRPSLIRTDADEITYNLHVIIRFELELELLEGRLAVKDLPAAWQARYAADLGVRVPDDRQGVLQDMHWFAGPVGGAFQGYTLGNVMAGQIYAEARRALPDLPAQIRAGEFGDLLAWLSGHLYRHGAKFTAAELLQRLTGGGLNAGPYLAYLRGKYGALYQLPA